MNKIKKLIADWSKYDRVPIYITTHSNNRQRRLKRDETGFYFIQYKKIERIEQADEIERIEQFLNIK